MSSVYYCQSRLSASLGLLFTCVLKKVHAECSFMLLAGIFLLPMAVKAQNPLSPAGHFNVFLQGNATLESNESEGAVAIGGNLTVKGYQVAFKPIATNGATPFTVGGVTIGLVVGGGVKLSQNSLKVLNNTYLKIGNCTAAGNPSVDALKIWFKDGNGAVSNIRLTKQGESYSGPTSGYIDVAANYITLGVDTVSNPVCQANVIDFAAAFTQLKANAAALTSCSVNTETWADGQKITDLGGKNVGLREVAGATGPRIWAVTGAQINALNNITLNFTPSASQPLIINVSTGADFTWNVTNQNVNGTMNYIIWNFPDVTGNLVIGGNATVEGSILAPNANVDKATGGNNSNIEGQLIAQSFTMTSGEMHTYPFLGTVPSCNPNVCVKPNAGKDSTVCGTTIQLSAPAQGETWAFLSSSNANTPTVTAGGLVSGMTVTGQYRFILKKITDADCRDTVTITRANFFISPISDKTICPGEILTFGYQGLSGVNYLWSTGGTGATITVAPVQTTNYTVKVTSQSLGCAVRDTIQVEVLPKPNAGKDTLICGSTVKLNAAANGQIWSYLSFNNPNDPAETATAVIDNQGNVSGIVKDGFYRFVLTNTEECTDTIRVQKKSVSLPVIDLAPICPGVELTFGYTNTTDFTYMWSTGDTTAQIKVSPTQTTNYYVTVTSVQTTCSVQDTVTVPVKPASVLTLVSSICAPNNVNYATTVTVTNGAVVTSNAGIVTGSGTTFTVTVGSDTTQYTITATLDGCKTRLTVNKPDCSCPSIASPTGTNGSVCGPGTVELSVAGCAAGTTAKWYSNMGLTTEVGSGNNFTTGVLSQTTDYYAACVNDAKPACKSTGVKVTATVKPLPSFSAVSTTCGSGNSTYTVVISSNGTVVVKSPSGPSLTGSGVYTITNVPAGQNLVLTTTLDGCSKDTTITSPNCSCIPETPLALAANVGICEDASIPNPTFTAIVGPNTTVDWYDAPVSGNLLASNTLTYTAPTAGTYYLQAKSTAQGCNSETNAIRLPVVLSISPKPIFSVQAQDPTCQGSTPQNNGSVSIISGTLQQRYAFNTTGFGTLPSTASNGDTIKALPVVIAPNILNSTAVTTYYIRVFSNEGCYKDTSVVVSPKTCVSDCPTLTVTKSTDTLCSGYYGEPIVVNVSDTSKIVRFVYFTTPQTGSSMYNGGTLIEEVKPTGTTVGAPNGLPGLQLPDNTTGSPVNIYVYAILKTPPTSTPNCLPFAEKIYTILPLPKFELDSIPACIGDTSYTVNLSITPAGSFTVYVAGSIASIGNGPIPGNVSQTINNVQGGGNVTALKISTTGPHFIIIKDANGCASAAIAPAPSFKSCDGLYDLALDKSVSTKTAKVGDNITYTLKVWNEGDAKATNVSVKDTLNAGVEFVTYATATGNYDAATKIWSIGDLAPGDTVTLQIAVKVIAQGVWFNTAEICSMTEKDIDSTPCNNDEEEDDIDRECITVPMELCAGEAIQVSVPDTYQDVKWFKDGGTEIIATGNVFLASEPGTYTFTAAKNTCPAQGCCPIIITESTNCCPPDLCIPFTIKQTKKGGKAI